MCVLYVLLIPNMPQRIIHEEIPEFTQQEKLVYSGHVSSLQQNV